MIDEILRHNREFVASKGYERFLTSKYPDKKIAIVTCMDTRLVELFKHRGAELHVSVGNPISVEQQKKYATVEDLGRYLRDETYALSLQK